jgi:hypothetical protein
MSKGTTYTALTTYSTSLYKFGILVTNPNITILTSPKHLTIRYSSPNWSLYREPIKNVINYEEYYLLECYTKQASKRRIG